MDNETGPVEATKGRGRPKGSKDKKQRKHRPKTKNPFGKCKNLLHRRVGYLVVIAKGPTNTTNKKNARALWIVQCDCGRTKTVDSRVITRQQHKSCSHPECPYRRLALSRHRAVGKMPDHMIDKAKQAGFRLTAEEVHKLTKAPCQFCGRAEPGQELRCFDHSKGYTLCNTYPICRKCVGIVPIGKTYHRTFKDVLQHLVSVVTYLSVAGHMDVGVASVFMDQVEAKEKLEIEQEINENILCF